MAPVEEFFINDLYKIIDGEHEYAGQVVELEWMSLDDGMARVSFTRVKDGYRFGDYEISLDALGAVADPVEYSNQEGGDSDMSEVETNESETPEETPTTPEEEGATEGSGGAETPVPEEPKSE